MGIFSGSRVFGIDLMVCGMVSFGFVSELAAGLRLSPNHADFVSRTYLHGTWRSSAS
jgi:hypothetical protein